MRMTLKRAIWLVPALLLAACDGSDTTTTGTEAADEGGLPPLVPLVSSDAVRVDAPATMSRAELARTTVRSSILGLHPHADFAVFREVDADGQHHVRLNQTLDGIRVYGADVVVHMQDQSVVGLGGNVLGEVDTDTFSATPGFDQTRALELAKKHRLNGAKIETTREEAELVVWLDGNKVPHLAYHTKFFTDHSDLFKPGLWNHIIDANTGAVIRSWNALHTLSQASGASGNAKFAHAWTNELDVEGSGTSYVAQTSRLKTVNLKNATSGSGSVFSGTLASFGDAAGNDAHGYAEVTLNMLRDWQGFNSIDNAGFVVVSRVHYGRNYENAFWDGTQMTYGDGASYFYPLSGAIDVVAHEIDHGFTEKHSGLDYSGQAGGMNESFSDVAGVTTSFYYNAAHASFDLGADIFKGTGALRYMCDPTADGSSIDNASRMTSGLDPHYSSGVGNKAFCRAAKRFSSGSPTGTATADGVKRASHAWFKANATYWTSTTSFVQACQGIYDAATSLGYNATELGYLRDAWSDVGVTCGGGTTPPTGSFPACDETITADSGTITSPNYPAVYGNNYARTWCVIPASGKSVTLKFNSFATETNYDYVYVYGADGVQASKTSGTTAPASITGKKIAVKFTTDYSVTKKGFTASFAP